MKKVVIVGCGAYMDSGYGCPGEWRCLKAAGLGDGKFEEPSVVVGFVKCECPGRTMAANLKMTKALSQINPDMVYLSSCMVGAKPGCPYSTPEEKAEFIKEKTGLDTVHGTHDYH
jgi:predicted metal-binding protein